ncbi:DUF551 domain-containing protein [Providencia stuartii]|nr:DUF551 domain-containing protein [Providencia stuartii]
MRQLKKIGVSDERNNVNRWRHLMQGTNWVKCSDSLPEDSTEVLVYCDDTKEMMVAYLDDDGDFCWLDQEILGTQLICYPSHWMPLPPMPEGK